ncbi:MAG: serine/threonine-protein kinase HipA [Actinomycetota bacterium]|nr:serine/threonine-protein kinase HipA [Actinomycetota bacterium]
MTYEPVDVVEVRSWGSRVGAVALDERSGFYAFEYDSAWSDRGVELAPTTMPTSAARGPFIFPTLSPVTYHRLPSMIADSIPDDFGNALTTRYLANEGVRADQITPLDRLAYLGNRGVGALEFRPMRGPRTRKPTAIELSELVVAARSAMSTDTATATATEGGISDAISQLIAVGTSAGGARAKAVVAWDPQTSELRSGQLPADPGFEHWIVKFDGVGRDLDLGDTGNYGRIEYAYYLMAVAAGIEMSDCRLLEEGGRAHFMTRRFDRSAEGAKVHTQTLCALGELDFRQIGAHDYAQLFLLLDELALGPDARAQVFRRMVFNVAGANCDDHTKNVSFLLPQGGSWQLAPAYDLTHAHVPESRWTRQHLMAVNGSTTNISRDDIDEVADRFAVPSAARIVADVLGAVGEWPAFAREGNVPEQTVEKINADIETSLLRLQAA